MNSFIIASAGLLAAWGLLSGCATPLSQPDQIKVTSDEVAAFVRENWSTYHERVARGAQRPDERPALVIVRSVSCQSYYGYPDCTVDVTVRFGGEPPLDTTFFATFERGENGALEDTIVLISADPRR